MGKRDIVDQIRDPKCQFSRKQAADEIERLRAELAAEREKAGKVRLYATAPLKLEAVTAERDALRELLLRWDALIEHQYTGSREAMSDMMECAQKTAQTLYGDPPWPTRIDAALNKGGGDE